MMRVSVPALLALFEHLARAQSTSPLPGGPIYPTTDTQYSFPMNNTFRPVGDLLVRSLPISPRQNGQCCSNMPVLAQLTPKAAGACCDPGEICCVAFDDGTHCADAGATCCGNDGQCHSDTPVCCLTDDDTHWCCDTGASCCGTTNCCAGACCDGTGCCPAGYDVCCGPNAYSSTVYCCGDATPWCCDTGCCSTSGGS
jgi:hypothetical protein